MKPNIIFITLDGLRRDRLSLCSNLMKFAEKNVFFPNMITAAPYTSASLHAIFSSLYPSKNGVDSYYSMFKFKKERCKTLSQYFKENGYYTAADVLDNCLLPNQGFDDITNHKEDADMLALHKKIITNASKKKPFFVYFQYSPIHNNVVANVAKKFSDFDGAYFNEPEKNRERFNKYVAECDAYVGGIIDFLEKEGLMEKSIIIFNSDHGVSNGEKKGEKIYGTYTYDHTLNVFCIFKIPGYKEKKVDYQCNTVDIMPTLLELNNIEIDSKFEKLQGRSLVSFLNGDENDDRPSYSETGGLSGPWPSPKKHNVFSYKYKDKKIIYNKTPDEWEFYDLKEDPKEENNLIEKDIAEIPEYKKKLLEMLKENGVKA